MATFQFNGMDDIIDFLKGTRQLTGQMAEDMVDAAAPIVIQTWKNVIRRKAHVDTGAMIESVQVARKKASVEYVYRDIYPQGKDKNGVRNAEKAFLLHYGWKSNATKSGPHDGDHFVDTIRTESEDEVYAAMEQVMSEYMERGM